MKLSQDKLKKINAGDVTSVNPKNVGDRMAYTLRDSLGPVNKPLIKIGDVELICGKTTYAYKAGMLMGSGILTGKVDDSTGLYLTIGGKNYSVIDHTFSQ